MHHQDGKFQNFVLRQCLYSGRFSSDRIIGFSGVWQSRLNDRTAGILSDDDLDAAAAAVVASMCQQQQHSLLGL